MKSIGRIKEKRRQRRIKRRWKKLEPNRGLRHLPKKIWRRFLVYLEELGESLQPK